MTGRTHRRLAAGLISCASVALSGCASVSDQAQNSSLRALATEEPSAPKVVDRSPRCVNDRFGSLPPSALPRPGHMPAKTFMREIQDRKRLIVGVDQNSLGLGYFNPISRRMQGFDIELVREIARAIFGNPASGDPDDLIRYIAISTKQRESVIVNKDVDIVASAFSITCARQRKMLFSSVYYRTQQRLLVLQDSNVDSLRDLRGKRVCATESSTSIERIKQEPGVVPFPVPLRSDCLVRLREGDVEAITADDAILSGFEQQDRQTKIVGPCLNLERYGLAINKDHSDFVRFVNGVLARLRRGRLEQIRRTSLKGLAPSTAADIRQCTRRDR